jgi:hypothetical protein
MRRCIYTSPEGCLKIMGLKEERKKGIRADTIQSLLYSWSKESKNNAVGKV